MQKRLSGRLAAGSWEFPGGKIESSETPEAALVRELKEEINVVPTQFVPWLVRPVTGPRSPLLLHFYRVLAWEGEATGNEGQEVGWFSLDAPPVPLLPANTSVWKWLSMPEVCLISAAAIIGVERSLAQLPVLLDNGLRLLQLRDKTLPADERRAFAVAAREMTRRAGARLLINDDEALARDIGADGIHLSSKALHEGDDRPPFDWVGASCHTADDLRQASRRQADFAVLSPVCRTLSHVDRPPMGWDGFAKLAAGAGFPVYALGGMGREQVAIARRHGGQGVALMRRGWETDDGG